MQWGFERKGCNGDGGGALNGTDRICVLTFAKAYLPGYKSGGPIQTIAGMVDCLAGAVDFLVYTSDRDAGDSSPYPAVKVDQWQSLDGARVYYASPKGRSFCSVRRLARSVKWNLLYLNSFFDPEFTLRPLLLWQMRMIPQAPVIIAPRGELSPGALALRSSKKRAFIECARAFGLYRAVVWQASSREEAAEIRSVIDPNARVVVAPNLRPRRELSAYHQIRSSKRKGQLRLVFLSRISPKKNLIGAICALRDLKGEVQFHVYGPVSRTEDREYWQRCAEAAATLPSNIKVAYKGVVPQQDVPHTLAKYDLFILPTQGENFGHAIIDALAAGCPVLLSDRTPWRGLRTFRAGWDVKLGDSAGFHKVLQEVVFMDQTQWAEWSEGASAYGQALINTADSIAQNRMLFQDVLGLGNFDR